MRLLAYGGTRYAERARVGRWSEALTSAGSDFEDTFDIPAGQGLLSYGVGIIDGTPVLILRERQHESDRGGYPYTLLLDPGTDSWQRFEWNAARLAASLRAHHDLWHQLMVEPQRLSSASVLESALSALPAADVGDGAAPEVGAALAATMQHDRLHVPISLIGLQRRPSLEDMARGLAAVPPFARVAGGWMMGGGRNGRRSFGCRAVFDDISPPGQVDPATTRAIEEGRELLALSAELFQSIDDKSLLDSIASPSAAWASPPGALPKILRLASAANRGATDRATVDEMAAFLSTSTPYGRPLLALWKRALANEPLDAVVSRALLQHDWDAIDAELGARLAPEALAAAFRTRQLTPASSGIERFALTPEREVTVWSSLVAGANDADQIVALVRDAVPRLKREQDVLPLVDRAVARTLDLQGTLRVWTPLRDRTDIWSVIGTSVSTAARNRVGTNVRWHVDYALLADDDGGTWLASRHSDEIAAVARAVLDEVAAGPYGDAARSWLSAMAATPARRHADLDQKLEVARRVGGRWSRLAALDSIFAGEPGRRVVTAPAPGDEELRALNEEFGELLDARARLASRPPLDLEAVDRAFDGRFDPAALSRRLDAVAPVTPESRTWLSGRGAKVLARQLSVQAWLDGGASTVPVDEIDEEGLALLVSSIFGGSAPPTDAERDLAADLLTFARQSSSSSPALTAMIAEALTTASRDPQKAARIAQLMASDADLTSNILGWIDARDAAALLQAAAHSDATDVARLVENLVSHVSEERPASSLSAIHALEDFLRRPSPAVRIVRDRAGRALFGADASHLPAYVSDLARTVEVEAAHQDQPDIGLIQRVRDWFQTRH